MALNDIVRCKAPLPPEVAGVTEWRTEDLGLRFQTYEIDAEGVLRIFRLERRYHEGHPPQPPLLDPAYQDWLRDWTTLEALPPSLVEFDGVLSLEGQDETGHEWMVEADVERGQCRPFVLHVGTPDACCEPG